MGKKIKVGKQRRDKYYRLAKEAGLRSRAVFKLTQLNKKFEFLQNCHVLVDLCAAPGGWLQVAAKCMPVSSLIIGVDLVSIKAMPNIITIQGDITTESCRQSVKSQLQTWQADCVLHDGAPNVGKNWTHDAFAQAQLTLSALKLATEVLKRGGWFITKIFRSADHPALIEVFKKLFKKVYVTKPEASRSESAEIYAVCRGFLKPEKIDHKLLDPKCVFVDLNLEPEKPRLNLMRPSKKRKKAEGYAEGDYTLHHKYTATQFVKSDKHLELLADANEIVIDSESINGHPSTTEEIRQCCRDIKVLGRKELRELMNWRRQIRQYLKSLEPPVLKIKESKNEGEEEPDEEVEFDDYVSTLKAEENREAKKKRRKEMKEKRTLKQKLDLKMVIPGDHHDYAEETDLFSLKRIKSKERGAEDAPMSSESEPDENYDSDGSIDFDDIGDMPHSHNDGSLLVDFNEDNDENSAVNKTGEWFKKDIFNDLVGDDDEDMEIERIVASKRHETLPKKKGKKSAEEKKYDAPKEGTFSTNEPDDDENGFDVVPQDKTDSSKKSGDDIRLNAEGLALAEMWIHSTKTRRDLIESAYNRYTNNDDNLPDWFAADEKKHWRKELPITKETVEYYKQKQREINARPIKKVAEAKARKRKRGLRRAEKARKRAEAVIENSDMTESQKAQEVRKIYKQSMNAKKKPEVTYVVAKKGQVGKRVRRPPGVSGQFKVVDKRLKKDSRKMKRSKR